MLGSGAGIDVCQPFELTGPHPTGEEENERWEEGCKVPDIPTLKPHPCTLLSDGCQFFLRLDSSGLRLSFVFGRSSCTVRWHLLYLKFCRRLPVRVSVPWGQPQVPIMTLPFSVPGILGKSISLNLRFFSSSSFSQQMYSGFSVLCLSGRYPELKDTRRSQFIHRDK